jgi:methionine synthase II (cobalamin-independent)
MPPTNIPTEPIGSIPRPQNLIDAMSQWNRSEITREAFDAVAQAAVSDTIRRFEASSADLVPTYHAVPVFIIKNLLRTSGMDRDRYFELLASS